MLEDLIIIIPTHNRQHYLGRVVKYYSSFPCKVYICDSSKQKTNVETTENISYRWVPQSNFYGKVLDVINDTSADYYALSPDDDFLKEETLMECYEKLNSNRSYSVGVGKQVFFDEPFDGVFYSKQSANRLESFKSIEGENKVEYINRFWKHYQNILWSLFRREVVLNAFKALSSCNFKNGNFVEVILGIESLRAGTIYVSNQGLNYREVSKAEHWGSTTVPITKDSVEKDFDLKNSIKKFYNYYSWDNGFAINCFDGYLAGDSEGQSKLSKLASFLPFSMKIKAKKLIYLLHKGKKAEFIDDIMKEKILSVL